MGESRSPLLPDFLTARAGIWHYARRVPLAYAEFDPRGVVRQSTKVRVVDDPRKVRARRAAAQTIPRTSAGSGATRRSGPWRT